jgi:hypothetical protein
MKKGSLEDHYLGQVFLQLARGVVVIVAVGLLMSISISGEIPDAFNASASEEITLAQALNMLEPSAE